MLSAVATRPDVAIAQDVKEDITAQQVREAIDRGVAFLRQQQKADGSWDDYTIFTGGVTALSTLALLNSGVEPGDPQIQKALSYLRKLKPERTYVTSLQTMVFARAEPQKDMILINRNVKWLESMQIMQGAYKGAWSYPGQDEGDNSNSQFAVLALHEAERAGVSVSDKTWRLAQSYWENCQNPDGSWGYKKNIFGTGSMTCAGITSLVITADAVGQPDAKLSGNKIQCCGGGENDSEDRLNRAMKWLGRQFFGCQESQPTRQSMAVLLPLRDGTSGTAHCAAVHRQGRLVS